MAGHRAARQGLWGGGLGMQEKALESSSVRGDPGAATAAGVWWAAAGSTGSEVCSLLTEAPRAV